MISTPIILAAPAFFAPMAAASPTPPNPQMATVDPCRTLAVLRAAPYPVAIAQPIRQTLSNGAAGSIFQVKTRTMDWDLIKSN